MKTIATLMLFMFIGAQFVNAQDQAAQTEEKTYTWNETTHDFGKLAQNDPATVTFSVKNNGTSPMIITSARSSCGCTVAKYTKEPIKPDETGIVTATYNSARVGSFNKTVTVKFDGSATSEVLRIKGTVERKPVEEPKSSE